MQPTENFPPEMGLGGEDGSDSMLLKMHSCIKLFMTLKEAHGVDCKGNNS